MSNKITFVEEEMKQITELQLAYVNLQNLFGQLGVNRLRLEQQVADVDASEQNLKTKFGEIQTAERDFVKSINAKYGDGNLDLATGVFTPTQSEKTPDKNKTL